ncbi:reverse transcriptase domain-containing protein [Tanacetum coccineum]
MQTRSAGQDPTTPYSVPERFIHQTLRKKKKRNPFIPIEDRVPKAKYPPFKNLFEAEVIYNPFLDLPFPMAGDLAMWGNNQVIAPTPGAAIVAVDLRDNFTVKGHHLSMIKDRQFVGRSRTNPHKYIVEFVEVCGMFHYGNTNTDAIKLKLFPSSLAGEAKIWFNELNPSVITTWEEMRQSFRDRLSQYRDEKRNSNPNEENPPIPCLPEKKLEESEFEKTMREFGVAQKASNDFVKNQFYNLKTKVEQGPKNHQAAIQDLETNGKTYDPPVDPNAKPAILLDDSKDEDDEVEKEAEPLPKKPTHADPPPLKAYKPKIPINIPLIDVLADLPHYGKFLKDLVSIKSKMKQISAAFLTEECSAILQNKLPSKLGYPGSFLIPCKLANSVGYLALDNLGASINLMPYSLKCMFPVDFVILQMEEDDRVPLILGRPFLHTADAIIRVKNKELNVGIREDRATFLINKAMQHSHLNDDTCFRMDIIDEVTEDELDALVDDSKPFLSTSEKISETPLDKEFKEFMTGNVQDDEVKDDFEELPPKDELRIKTSIQDPPTDLEMKPLPKHLEYAFLEENSLLPIDISALLEQNEKE